MQRHNYWPKLCAIVLIMLFPNNVYADDPPPSFIYNDKSEMIRAIYTHSYIIRGDYQKGIIFKLTAEKRDSCLTFEIIFPNPPKLKTQKNLPATHLCEFSSEIVSVNNARWPKKVTAKSIYYTFHIEAGTTANYYDLQWIGNTPVFIMKYTGGNKGNAPEYFSCGIKSALDELEEGFTGAVTKPSIHCFPLDIDGSDPSASWSNIPHKSLLETGNAQTR